jgi:hypothetical protein
MADCNEPFRAAGFSLVTLSVILTAASIVMASMLPGKDAGDVNAKTLRSTQRMQVIENAMRGFMANNLRRPCPANPQYAPGTANFGIEAASPAASSPCTGGTPAAPLGPDSTGYVVGGSIPTRSLDLPDDYAYDEWGRMYTYVVDRRATYSQPTQTPAFSCYGLTATMKYTGAQSGIQINDSTGTAIDHVMYAYISHGPDGDGAFPAQGGRVSGRIVTGTTDADTLTNASLTAGGALSFTNVKVRKAPTATFGGIVYYNDQLKNTCCIGPTCQPFGFQVTGLASSALAQTPIAVGDINGDGVADLVIGSACVNNTAGSTYVIYGTKTGFPNPLPQASMLNGTNGFRINGVTAGDCSGESVAVADVNGDGYGDIIIGAPLANGTLGYTYVVFGGPTRKSGTAWAATQTLATGGSNLINGTDGFRLDGISAGGGWTGWAVAAGDVNGDGYADIVTSAIAANNSAGYVYVVFGGPTRKGGTAWGSNTLLNTGGANIINGTDGFRLDGVTSGDTIGTTLATGDVNGDGYADIVIGAPNTHAGAGYNYVVFGGPTRKGGTAWGVNTVLNTGGTNIINGTDGFRLDGVTTNDTAGWAVATGDINGDGYADIIIGAFQANNRAGYVYTVFGGPTRKGGTAWPAAGNLVLNTGGTNIINGTDGFRLDGVTANDQVGYIGVTAGDINGDGYDDLVLGAGAANSNAGYTYVVFGGPTRKSGTAWGVNTVLNTGGTNIINGTDGFRLNGVSGSGYTSFGSSLAVGDINGDGIKDLLINAYEVNGLANNVYAIFGHRGAYPWPSTPLTVNLNTLH